MQFVVSRIQFYYVCLIIAWIATSQPESSLLSCVSRSGSFPFSWYKSTVAYVNLSYYSCKTNQTWVESARAFTAKQDSKTAYQQKSHEKGASEVGGIAVPHLPSVAILTIHAAPRLPKRSPANSTVPRSNLCSAAFICTVTRPLNLRAVSISVFFCTLCGTVQ